MESQQSTADADEAVTDAGSSQPAEEQDLSTSASKEQSKLAQVSLQKV